MSQKSETRLRDKSGRIFLDAASLKNRKGFERFKVKPDADFDEVEDASAKAAKKPRASKKAAAKKLDEQPAEKADTEKPSSEKKEDVLAGWEE